MRAAHILYAERSSLIGEKEKCLDTGLRGKTTGYSEGKILIF